MLNRRMITIGAVAVAALAGAGWYVASSNASVPSLASLSVGTAAPQFTGIDSNGNEINLADYTGQKVVLEWTNHLCPYVQKHYDTRNMQQLQAEATVDGVVWLTVISSAPGKQGNVTAEQANGLTEERGASPSAIILDESGAIGQMYGAMTTPHMYVIDEEQMLRYIGAIDDNNSSRKSTVEGATNYVRQALVQLDAGEEISVPQTTAYGCTVKY